MNGQAWKKKEESPDGGNSSGQWSHLVTGWIQLDSTHSLGKSPSWNHHQKTLFKPPCQLLISCITFATLKKDYLMSDAWKLSFFLRCCRFQIWKTQNKGYEKELNLYTTKPLVHQALDRRIIRDLKYWYVHSGSPLLSQSLGIKPLVLLDYHCWWRDVEDLWRRICQPCAVPSWVKQMLSSVWNLSLQDLSPPDLGSTATVIFQLLDQPSVARHLTTSPKRSGGHLQLLHLCPIRRQIYAGERVHQAICKMRVHNFFALFCRQFHEFEVSSSK